MRPASEGASGREWGQPDRIAEDTQRTGSVAERGVAGKQAMPELGNCIACGQHIRLIGGATTCPTCAAWRRWFVAQRIASRYLREATR